MASQIQKNFRARKTFAKLKQVIEIPNLIDIQKRSYDKFLQIDVPIDKRDIIHVPPEAFFITAAGPTATRPRRLITR